MAQPISESESFDQNPGPLGEMESLRFLCEQYRNKLLSSCYAPIRALTCRIDEQTQKVVVSGELPSFYLKQQAQELLIRSFGITSFSNAIQVEWTDDQGSCSDSMTATSPNLAANFDDQ